MTTIGIDLGSEFVRLACRDGGTLRVIRAPAEPPRSAWPAWIARLGPPTPYEVVFRAAPDIVLSDQIEVLAQTHGATRARIVTRGAEHDPALPLLRTMMPLHRCPGLVYVEVGARCWQCGVLDRLGRLTSHRAGELSTGEADSTGHVLTLAHAIRNCLDEIKPSNDAAAAPQQLAAFGGNGPTLAVAIAEQCGLSKVLVPDYAASLAAVGMLIQNRVLEFRASLSPQPVNVTKLRYVFARLMDEAAHAVTMEGFDIDDTICERFAELGVEATNERITVECETMADAGGLIEQYRRACARRAWQASSTTDPLIHAIGIRVTIESTSDSFPLQTWRTLQAGAPPVSGPARLCEDDMTIVVPAFWHAVRSPAGGVILERS